MKIRTERGRLVYDINVKAPGGHVRERANVPSEIRTESAAKRWAEARALHLSKHGKEEEVAPAPTLAEFTSRWMTDYAQANGNKPSTIDAKERINRLHILPVLGAVRVDAIGDAEVQRLKLALGTKAAKTQGCILAQLSTILTTASRWNLIVKAPHIELPRVADTEMEFYDFDEWERLVAGAANAGPHVLAMVLLGGEAGHRRGEMLALEQTDCGPKEIVICRNEWRGHFGTPKGGKTRRVPLTDRLRIAIAKARHLRGPRLLFKPDGGKVRIATLQSWLELACRRAGLTSSRNLHKLRHTFCSHLAMRGATAKAIQELAGHADIKTTMRYMHLSPAHRESAIKLLEQRGASGAGVEQVSEKT